MNKYGSFVLSFKLLTYTGSISDEPRMEPSPGIGSLASDQDRGTKIRYKILDEGVSDWQI